MREIRHKTISAGPEGSYHPGHVRTLPEHEAAALVRGGYAEYTTIGPPERAVIKPPESETVAPEEISTEETKKQKGRSKK